MKIFHGTENANIMRPTVLTLGVFDGLHLGHQRIMQTVVERAKAVDARATAITFDPHPRAVLHPESAPPLLQTLDQRLANFEVLGIEQAIVVKFDREFASQPAADFLSDIIRDRLHAKEVYLGKGFAFGKDRSGNIDLLRKKSIELGFVADEVEEVQIRGQRISSSTIRKLLSEGKINLARRMLGRPYGVEGVIIRGDRRGHTIGFPTANLKPHNRVIPRFGVYATATLIDGIWRKSITNIGVRPTFEKDADPSIESYIFDFDGDLYGNVLRVRFLHRIRDERKFNGIDELKAQIEKDSARARNYFHHQGVKNMLALFYKTTARTMAETKTIERETNAENAERNGHRSLVPTDELAIAKLVTNKQLIEEERSLQKVETSVEGNYHGIRGYWRIFEVSRVIAMLSLYLYLDQLEIHQAHQEKQKQERLDKAMRLTRAAVYGEKLYAVRLWFFQSFMLLLRRFFVGNSENKEANQEKQAVWLKEKLIELGPTFIKMGQSMGTRADLLPLPFVKELGTLVDQVPPFPNDVAFSIIEHELGHKINEVYAEFELEPVAAASLGQVYRARLHTGEEVAVKVQRPNLEATIKGDIVILKKVANFAERFPQLNENADWSGMLREFDTTIHEEMDYAAEGRNAERFRDNFKNWSNVHVPTIYWNATTSKVLTMEFIHGTKVTDLEEQARRNISPAKVNRLLIKTYLKQLLEDGFFHADPHPGNLLVMADGTIAFFDFGMVGRITPQLQAKMIDAFFHVVDKDPGGIAEDLIELDFLKPGTPPHIVKPVVEKMFQFHFNLKLKDVNFKELTYDLADVMYDYPFRLPSNFTYIMRALMTLEGIGIITDPEFNFFETAKPFAKEFMLRREGNDFRKMFVNKIMGRDEGGKIDWDRTWKLAKMAFRTVLNTG